MSSDHVGWPAARKRGDDIFELASGAPGVELILPLMHDALVERGLPLSLLARLLCEAPARRFGLWPRKGGLLPGADADLVILDPQRRGSSTRPRSSRRRAGARTPGGACAGGCERTLARGEEVFAGGAVSRRARAGRPRQAGGDVVRSGPVPELGAASSRCRGWRQETLLRLLENVLELAERPDDLVVYAAHARAARDRDSYERDRRRAARRWATARRSWSSRASRSACCARARRARVVLMANGNLVGRWATPERFYALEARG